MSNVYIGFSVDFPEVRDPHITIAFVPHAGEEYDRRGLPESEDTYGRLMVPMKNLYDHIGGPFNVKSEEIKLYGIVGNEIRVLEVEMPPQIYELVIGFRQSMHARGIKYSLDFPFRPHISIGDINPYIPDLAPQTEYRVTGLFIDNGEERRTLHLK